MKQLSSQAERGGADKPRKCSPVTLNLYLLPSEKKMSQGRQGWRWIASQHQYHVI